MTRTAVFLFALLLAGCAPSAINPAPTGTAGPSGAPSPVPTATGPVVTQVGSAAQAAAVVFASQGFGRIGPLQPDVIGQSSWYDAAQDGTAFVVHVTVGAGDCQAGCIEQHVWTYRVEADGSISSVSEEGDDVPLPTDTGTADPVNLQITLTAGPTCPVVRDPPDPACAPRPVANGQIDVYDVSGNLVASGRSGVDGIASAQPPAGAYFAVAAAVEGLMGQPEPLAFAALGGDTVAVTFTYDTGIR
jgi:hypothetical protein